MLSARAAELTRRAELATELAERAERPVEPFVHGNADALACELYVQAIYWTLAAHHAERDDGPESSLASLWERTDLELLVGAAGGSHEHEHVRASVSNKTFADFAELTRSQQLDLARRLAEFSNALLAPLQSARQQRARRRSRRSLRLGGVALVLAILVFAAFQALAWSENRRDLARRAAWTPSSIYPVLGCRSPAQVCAESPNYFFHTLQETNPSVTFDLRSKKGISTVVVENRLDFGLDRAVPLVVSVSDDQKRWKEVARRRDVFTIWRAKFPRVRARYVRIHVQGAAMILHLSRVRILP